MSNTGPRREKPALILYLSRPFYGGVAWAYNVPDLCDRLEQAVRNALYRGMYLDGYPERVKKRDAGKVRGWIDSHIRVVWGERGALRPYEAVSVHVDKDECNSLPVAGRKGLKVLAGVAAREFFAHVRAEFALRSGADRKELLNEEVWALRCLCAPTDLGLGKIDYEIARLAEEDEDDQEVSGE